MRSVLFSICCLALLSGSCKKSKDEPVNTADYQPLTTGSNWTYNTTANGGGTYKVTVSGRDSSINGKAYAVLTNNNGPNNYVNKTGSDYYRFAVLQLPAGAAAVEFLYLKDNLAVNGAWENTQTISGIPLKLKYKIIEKDVTRVVDAKTYNSVVKVSIDIFATVAGIGEIGIGTAEAYLARGIGMVQFIVNISFGGTTNNEEQKLQQYEIK
jgi:hypothetical protein